MPAHFAGRLCSGSPPLQLRNQRMRFVTLAQMDPGVSYPLYHSSIIPAAMLCDKDLI